jgi:hypothetical protein
MYLSDTRPSLSLTFPTKMDDLLGFSVKVLELPQHAVRYLVDILP